MPEILGSKQVQEKAAFKVPRENQEAVDPEHKFTAEEWAEENLRNNLKNFRLEDFQLYQRIVAKQKGQYDIDSTTLMFRIKHGEEPKFKEIDFAHEEALRDNREWNRKFELKKREGKYQKELKKEYAEYLKMQQLVIQHIKDVRDDPQGRGLGRNIMIYALGGGLNGPNGAGQVVALNRLRCNKVFKVASGSSAGLCDEAYMLGYDENQEQGNDLEGTAIYYNECCTDEFLATNPKYFIKNPLRLRQIMNVGVAADVMAGDRGNKRLNVENVMANPTKLVAQVTSASDKSTVFLDAKSHGKEGIVTAVHASMALPVVYRKTIEIDGKHYIDGSIESFPIDQLIEEVAKPEGITDILILPQIPFETMDEIEAQAVFGMTLAALIPRTASLQAGSLTLLEKALKNKEGLRQALLKIKEETGINIGILFPPDEGLTMITQDRDRIKAGVLASAKATCEAFGEPDVYKDIHLL